MIERGNPLFAVTQGTRKVTKFRGKTLKTNRLGLSWTDKGSKSLLTVKRRFENTNSRLIMCSFLHFNSFCFIFSFFHFLFGKNNICFFQHFLRLCATTGVSTAVDKLQLRHLHGSSTVWTMPSLHSGGRVNNIPKNCAVESPVFCAVWHHANLSLWHNWNVQHSDDELDGTDCWNLYCVVTLRKQQNWKIRSRTCRQVKREEAVRRSPLDAALIRSFWSNSSRWEQPRQCSSSSIFMEKSAEYCGQHRSEPTVPERGAGRSRREGSLGRIKLDEDKRMAAANGSVVDLAEGSDVGGSFGRGNPSTPKNGAHARDNSRSARGKKKARTAIIWLP